MRVLLTYPEYPPTFFSFKYSLHLISKKAALPPLGLITVSSLLPHAWEKRLVDLNTAPLLANDLHWADFVFISAMHIQKASVDLIVRKCKEHGVKIVAGGPLFSHDLDDYPQVDHFICNEAEITLKPFLEDLAKGRILKRVYETGGYADLSESPIPDFHLLQRKSYASMSLQMSRGCPFSCDFCEITTMLGHTVRMKQSEQVLEELDALYRFHWKGSVSIVDDNFMGNKNELKKQVLPAMNRWMKQHNYPFIFNVQTPINLADDLELVRMMLKAGINSTFIGLETPSELSNQASNKIQNTGRNLLQDVRAIQNEGMLVSGGFILGFDSDTPSIFDQQVDLIQEGGIVWAMVGLLNAPKNTRLYKRLKEENRIGTEVTGNNTDFSMNFIPGMDREELLRGYRLVLQNTYSFKPYYNRVRTCLLNLKQSNRRRIQIDSYFLLAFLKSISVMGIREKGREEFWKILFWTLWKRPRLLPYTIMFTICGYHFRKLYEITEP